MKWYNIIIYAWAAWSFLFLGSQFVRDMILKFISWKIRKRLKGKMPVVDINGKINIDDDIQDQIDFMGAIMGKEIYGPYVNKYELSKWLEKNVPHYFPNKGDLINLIEIIAEATIPIRGLLEKGISSREIRFRMDISEPTEGTKNIYDEEQIHEDILTHSIILTAIQESDTDFTFIASEEYFPSIRYFAIAHPLLFTR